MIFGSDGTVNDYRFIEANPAFERLTGWRDAVGKRIREIIPGLENCRRGVYAGAVGYLAYGGQTMDTAISIRTMIARGDVAWLQAGAGIVADSVPEKEFEETVAKAGALVEALRRTPNG